jgi:hypothetical protein
MKRILFACCLTFPACALFAQTSPLLSEDFESGQIDSKVWEKRVTGVATIQVQQDQVAHGRYALQVHYPEMATPEFLARRCSSDQGRNLVGNRPQNNKRLPVKGGAFGGWFRS